MKIVLFLAFFYDIIQSRKGELNMKNDIKTLKTTDISSNVFVITPELIDVISQKFGDTMAEAMNVRPLAHKIREIAKEILTQVLQDTKKIGE